MLHGKARAFVKRGWPWLVLGAVAAIAIWHTVDFSEARDTDFPRVIRPYFSALPPGAYRLAEPGDTLDRIALYLSTGGLVLSLAGIIFRLHRGDSPALWPTSAAIAVGLFWHASTPGPTFDGWHGLGWREIFDPAAPLSLRIALVAAGLGLAAVAAANIGRNRHRLGALASDGRARGVLGLLMAAAVLIGLRQVEFPGVEPAGYWPRCAFDLGVLAFVLALIRLRPVGVVIPHRKLALGLAAGWAGTVLIGLGVVTLHRPLSRLRAIVPGRIYMSAMPTYTGLKIEQERLHFRTIINLFDETSPQRSPRHEDELRFARENGIHYLGSPADGMESDRFLDETLRLAQDPSAWPILVHCHGCMDRTPAWMGIYRFLVEGKPMADIYREIERHRGTRPKAVVMLQYNRKLPSRNPERFANDPTARNFPRWINGTPDPYAQPGWRGEAPANRVSARTQDSPAVVRP
ncbi:protein tyrosine phosphatase [Tundrisphaera sp. TA3]|uniref:protein tyrosine phosphatase n=1 Tax=Tundrisphaera sp. TA3 TaxID=3435775 RepID=UPI003EBE5E82